MVGLDNMTDIGICHGKTHPVAERCTSVMFGVSMQKWHASKVEGVVNSNGNHSVPHARQPSLSKTIGDGEVVLTPNHMMFDSRR